MMQALGTRARQAGAAVAAALLVLCCPFPAHADNYGNGPYGGGLYGAGTSSSSSSGSPGSTSSGTPASSSPHSESTVVQTPSGLEVAINLTDGQAIPPTGYYITITPINGQGKTFDRAEIYLDGVLAYTGSPDSTGTLKWLWDTSNHPATKVKIIVYGPGNGVTTHEFNVIVTPVAAATSNPTTPNQPSQAPSSGWPAWAWWLVAGIVALVLFIVWLLLRRRRQAQPPPPPTVFTPMQQ